ncbi:hypothetical protein A2Y85_05220 [candidate division WOR-3 bacterium RBG_13_43_14]|uniref:SsuA/THI5-like domain-containing protein n=1 Tax=candidate division WOR-3 bacterium RBG_13_43_14 TaxID=1802590 RepID=A0A1F4UEE1_UNCW3|nr:MAG: hypothetical protein A2Y85_05220 [candidate division WOR-3 bacterium RBG_13_43_14]
MNIKVTERLLNVFIFFGIIALLFVVGYPQYKESLPVKVRIGVDRSFASMPFYVAEMDTSHQYFVIEKINPEFIETSGDPLQGLKEGRYDIVAVPWYSLLMSPGINGDTVKACASLEFKSSRSLDAIIIPPESKIRGLKDLKGKRLGYLAPDEYLISLILPKLAEDKIIKIATVILRPEELATAFEENKVDALFVVDPYRGYMLYLNNQVLFEGIVAAYVSSTLPYYAIVMRKNYVKKESRIAAIRLRNAIDATLGYINRNPEIVKRMAIKKNAWPNDDLLSLTIRVPEYQRLAEVNLRSVEAFQTEMVRRGIGTCGIKPSEFLFEKTDFVR